MKLFFAFVFAYLIGAPEADKLRNGYFEAAVSKEHLPAFLKSIENHSKKDHIYYCYKSAYYSLAANFSASVTKKLGYFNLCKENIAKSLLLTDNFDARFIRFCIQSESPALLGYTQNRVEDKKYILEHLKAEPQGAYKTNVKAYLAKSKFLTEPEKTKLKNL